MEEGSEVMAYWRRSPRQMQAATNQVAVERMTEEELLKGLEGLAPPEEQPEEDE